MKKKYLKRIISIGVIFALVATMGGICLFPSTSYGATFTEDFSTSTYKDSANTTADWNTLFGKLELPQSTTGYWTKADGSSPVTRKSALASSAQERNFMSSLSSISITIFFFPGVIKES